MIGEQKEEDTMVPQQIDGLNVERPLMSLANENNLENRTLKAKEGKKQFEDDGYVRPHKEIIHKKPIITHGKGSGS